ncbi:uncharacterized protein LOC105835030 isoform X2 [Monomorium pharaonis]|uniref:uncharacterized protein LOC105835030 isoform X2 n=1 Tax=Monomorium pharaonis TaxID=307658 RepID=UPI0017478EBE|nr:uncharacterized protein LOC105835030 isoform X2 [Monomorium pharaonis]XP_036140635.1 uncharacterized protein LOC105835030 isoform X2 [Monomorium pharaonis]
MERELRSHSSGSPTRADLKIVSRDGAANETTKCIRNSFVTRFADFNEWRVARLLLRICLQGGDEQTRGNGADIFCGTRREGEHTYHFR